MCELRFHKVSHCRTLNINKYYQFKMKCTKYKKKKTKIWKESGWNRTDLRTSPRTDFLECRRLWWRRTKRPKTDYSARVRRSVHTCIYEYTKSAPTSAMLRLRRGERWRQRRWWRRQVGRVSRGQIIAQNRRARSIAGSMAGRASPVARYYNAYVPLRRCCRRSRW